MIYRVQTPFQYRKRYGLHAIFDGGKIYAAISSFNTASGMDCMQFMGHPVTIVRTVCFNTASGMDCMQFEVIFWMEHKKSFNTASGMDCMQWRGTPRGNRS